MGKKLFILGLALLVTVGLLPRGAPVIAAAEPTAYDQPGAYQVKTLEFPDLQDAKRQGRKVPLKVHFPAAEDRFPLVIISHGGGGNWDANLYQARHLASHGYVVVCVEHVDSNGARLKYYMSRAGGGMRFWAALHKITKDAGAVLERPRDVSFAIDQAILWNANHPELAGKIETDKIAVMGHSFGAYTTLVVCGARPILDYLEPPVGGGKGLAPDLSDQRVTFGLAMSPQSPGTTYFGPESYRSIDRPLVCLTGSGDIQKRFDGWLLGPQSRWEVFRLLPPGRKYFLWLENADHLSFSDSPKAYLLPSRARADAQRLSEAMMVVFCDYFLKGEQRSLAAMNEGYVNSLCGPVVTRVRWLEK